MDAIEIQGETYIRARDAAKEVGYTGDYVGQLSRSGKIIAKRVGRAWYVREGELVRHKSGERRSNFEKTRQSIQRSQNRAQDSLAARDSRHTQQRYTSAFRQSLLDVDVSYEKDEMPLLPTIKKRENNNVKHLSVKDEAEAATGKTSRRTTRTSNARADHAKGRSGPLKEGSVLVTSLDEDDDTYELIPDTPLDEADADSLEITRNSPHTTFSEKIALTELRGRAKRKKQEPGMGERVVNEASNYAKALVPLILLVLMTIVIANTFLHNVWLYESSGINSSEEPRFRTEFGLTSITTITSKISR